MTMPTTSPALSPAQRQLAQAFETWERRYRADPDRFMSDVERLAQGPVSYGDACALYLTELLSEAAVAAVVRDRISSLPTPGADA